MKNNIYIVQWLDISKKGPICLIFLAILMLAYLGYYVTNDIFISVALIVASCAGLTILSNHYYGLLLSIALYQFTFVREFSKYILLVSAFSWLLSIVISKRPIKFNKTFLWLVLFMAIAFMSVIASAYLAKDLYLDKSTGLYSPNMIGFNSLMQLSFSMIILIYIYNAVNSRQKMHEVLKYFIVSATLVALFSLINYTQSLVTGYGINLPILRNGGLMEGGYLPDRNIGFAYEPLIFSNQLLAVLPLAIALIIMGGKEILSRYSLMICGGILFITLMSTFSAGGIGALVIALLALIFFNRDRLKSKKYLLIAVVTIFIVLRGIQWGGEYFQMNVKDYVIGKISVAILNPYDTKYDRAASTVTIVNMFTANPLLGVGFGNYAYLYNQYRPAGSLPIDAATWRANNDWLTILAETGIFGFAAFALFILSVFVQAVRLADSRFLFQEKGILVGLIITNMALWIQAFAGFYFQNSYIWVMLGLLLAAVSIQSKENSTNDNRI